MLDEIDLAIISYLQYDGRAPFTQIAESLNISEGAVRRRVKNLSDSGLMQVVAIVEPHALGLNEGVLIGINVQADMTQEVADAVAKLPEVSYLFQAAGEFDLFAEVFCQDRNHFVSFLNTKLQKIPGIERTQSFLILKMHKLSYRWGDTGPAKNLSTSATGNTTDT
ncbi:MAG TPA: AsnC family transcriptional regulator [Chloroflexi bacterium]|nr:AsnC family transcriptional regulator [Chloroflexota bacterium]